MFHWVTGIPFENDLHGGAYDDLTLWEQIDEGAQYTPAKKWLFCVPIVLWVLDSYDASIHPLTRVIRFLASTHYTNYNPWLFAVNLSALIFVLIPKLPQVRDLLVPMYDACALMQFHWISCTAKEYGSWLTIHQA